jgi:ASC-1-like (ASCH) protein
MKIFNIVIQEPYFSNILSGNKTIEGRLNKGKFKKIKVGDLLRINNFSNFRVVGKNNYKFFRELLEKEGFKNVIPDKGNIEEAIGVYNKFYSSTQEEEFGVVAFKIVKE